MCPGEGKILAFYFETKFFSIGGKIAFTVIAASIGKRNENTVVINKEEGSAVLSLER